MRTTKLNKVSANSLEHGGKCPSTTTTCCRDRSPVVFASTIAIARRRGDGIEHPETGIAVDATAVPKGGRGDIGSDSWIQYTRWWWVIVNNATGKEITSRIARVHRPHGLGNQGSWTTVPGCAGESKAWEVRWEGVGKQCKAVRPSTMGNGNIY